MPINILALIPMSINSSQCWSMPINARSSRVVMYGQFLLMFYWTLDPALIGIERNWSELMGKDWHWKTSQINVMILIGIDRHWALIEGVLSLLYTGWKLSSIDFAPVQCLPSLISEWTRFVLIKRLSDGWRGQPVKFSVLFHPTWFMLHWFHGRHVGGYNRGWLWKLCWTCNHSW